MPSARRLFKDWRSSDRVAPNPVVGRVDETAWPVAAGFFTRGNRTDQLLGVRVARSKSETLMGLVPVTIRSVAGFAGADPSTPGTRTFAASWV